MKGMISTLAETKRKNFGEQKNYTLKIKEMNVSLYIWRIIW